MIEKNVSAYKSIGEVAKILDLVNKKKGTLNTHAIRFWEKEFKQIKPKILNGNRRYYNKVSIEVLKKIKYLLKDQGMTINGAKKVLNYSKPWKLDETKKEAFMHQIALNVIPHIDVPQENGFTKEEMKMVNETQKILKKDIAVAATCVRVPVLRSHSESITVTFKDGIDVDVGEAKNALEEFENVEVLDDIKNGIYPMPMISTDTDLTYVGRLRKDIYDNNVLHMFNAADQVRVGAATNSVRIAIKWIEFQKEDI